MTSPTSRCSISLKGSLQSGQPRQRAPTFFTFISISRSIYLTNSLVCLLSMFLSLYIERQTRLTQWVECSPMVRETGAQSLVESCQRLFKKCYLIPPCLILCIIGYVSSVKWSNPRKKVATFSIPRCSSYWKGAFTSP